MPSRCCYTGLYEWVYSAGQAGSGLNAHRKGECGGGQPRDAAETLIAGPSDLLQRLTTDKLPPASMAFII